MDGRRVPRGLLLVRLRVPGVLSTVAARGGQRSSRVYTVAVLVGAWWWGKAWVRRGEGFGALFGTLAQLFRRRDPGVGPGLAPLLIAYLGGIVFDALSQTSWWIDVLGTSRGWTERAINTVGFAWSIGLVALGVPGDDARRRGDHRQPTG